MDKYINQQTLQNALERKQCGPANKRYTEGWNDCLMRVKSMVSAAPIIDAVPVVRCKDCKHLCVWNRKDIYAFCPKTNIVFLPFDKDTRTFFCGLGERKDGVRGSCEYIPGTATAAPRKQTPGCQPVCGI